jgi:hypothetical protein
MRAIITRVFACVFCLPLFAQYRVTPNPCDTTAQPFQRGKIILFRPESDLQTEITEDEANELIEREAFQEVKSCFHSHFFEVEFSLNWKSFMFRFDTRVATGLAIPFRRNLPFLTEPHDAYDGRILQIHKRKTVAVNRTRYSVDLTVYKHKGKSTVGMAFIKAFDWIVDAKNRKVYFRKNEFPIETRTTSPPAVFEIQQGDLIVTSKIKALDRFSIGERVIAVLGEAVDQNNACRILTTITLAKDFENLSIETVKIPKTIAQD